jgi:hypothetical protein
MIKMMARELTSDGLPVVEESTFVKFVKTEYDISSPNGDPAVTERIERENPQIARILRLGMENAPNRAAAAYYETGIQIVYELLRKQSAKDKR